MTHTFNRRRFLYSAKRRGKSWGWTFIRAIFILGFSFVILYPLLNMLARAFMAPQDLYDSSVLWLHKHFTLINLKITARSLK